MAQLLIPPLSVLRGEKSASSLGPLHSLHCFLAMHALPKDLIESMVLHNNRDFHCWQWVTHIFVHTSYDHLFANILATMQVGLPIHSELGPALFYALFISGGIFSALPSLLHEYQHNSLVQLWGKVLKANFSHPYIPNQIDSYASVVASKLGSIAAKIVVPNLSCGSSGAVYSLMGCELVLAVKDLVCLTRSENNKVRESTSFQLKVVVHALSISRICAHLLCELESVLKLSNYSFRTSMRLTDRVFKAMDLATVGHVAHLQGALFGVGFGVVFGVILPSLQKRRL